MLNESEQREEDEYGIIDHRKFFLEALDVMASDFNGADFGSHMLYCINFNDIIIIGSSMYSLTFSTHESYINVSIITHI